MIASRPVALLLAAGVLLSFGCTQDRLISTDKRVAADPASNPAPATDQDPGSQPPSDPVDPSAPEVDPVSKLTIPKLLAPLDTCVTATSTPTLSWNAVAEATSYDVALGRDGGFSVVLWSAAGIEQTSLVLPELGRGGYFWRVVAHASQDRHSTSEPGFFVLAADLPALTATPVPTPTCEGSQPFAWSDSMAGGARVSYEVQVSTSSDFSSVAASHAGIRAASYDFAMTGLPSAATYFWRVGRQFYNCPTAWADGGSFYITEQPLPPEQVTGRWSSCSSPYTVELSWVTPDDGVTDALFELDTNGTVQSRSDTGWVESVAAGLYHWRVRRANAACSSPWVDGRTMSVGAGQTWTEVKPSRRFDARWAHGAIADDQDRLWVIGGEVRYQDGSSGGTDRNDVWMTADGDTWVKKLASAAFPLRRWFGTAFFQNKLWVLAGNQNASATNLGDVWSSSDGLTWTQTAQGTHFGVRHAPGVTVFQDKLWLVGGEEAGCLSKNDVWTSDDGVSWTLVTAHGDFPPRDWLNLVAFQDKLWVIGGVERQGGCVTQINHSDVWSSPDGIEWTQEVEDGVYFAGRGGQSAVVYEDRIWVLGGTQGYPFSQDSDIWSFDGYEWCNPINNHPGFEDRFDGAAVVYNGQLWWIAGRYLSWYSNDQWTTGIAP
jgi:hypothetical protein